MSHPILLGLVGTLLVGVVSAGTVPAPAEGSVPRARAAESAEGSVPRKRVAEPAEGTVPRKRAAEFAKEATSANGFVRVLAADVPGDTMGFRLPLLRFASQFVSDLERGYKLEMPRSELPGIVIHALDGKTNDVRVIARKQTREGGAVFTRIWLPSPGYCSLEALRFELARAYLRAWVDRNRGTDGTPAAEVPNWLAMGFFRAMTPDGAHNDIRGVLEMWSENDLPELPQLCAELKLRTFADAVRAGYIVGWMKEKRVLQQFLTELAAGRPIRPVALASALTGQSDAIEQNRASEKRLRRLAEAVLSPGQASAWDLKVFAARLLLFPAKFDKNITTNTPSCTFREAIGRAAAEKGVRLAAAQKAREMPFYALGRGQALADVAEAYRKFLVALAQGEKPDALEPLLDKADRMLAEMRKNPGAKAPPKNEDRKDNNR